LPKQDGPPSPDLTLAVDWGPASAEAGDGARGVATITNSGPTPVHYEEIAEDANALLIDSGGQAASGVVANGPGLPYTATEVYLNPGESRTLNVFAPAYTCADTADEGNHGTLPLPTGTYSAKAYIEWATSSASDGSDHQSGTGGTWVSDPAAITVS
jgi:hypothetical protein